LIQGVQGFQEAKTADIECSKENGTKAAYTTDGLFIGVCQHQICYGFHFMGEPEGRKDLFYVLSRFWPIEVNFTILKCSHWKQQQLFMTLPALLTIIC
jgi:hypothetical protein